MRRTREGRFEQQMRTTVTGVKVGVSMRRSAEGVRTSPMKTILQAKISVSMRRSAGGSFRTSFPAPVSALRRSFNAPEPGGSFET